MVGSHKRLAVTTNCTIVGGRGVEDVSAVDFLRLLEGLNKAKVAGSKLCLIEVVINALRVIA
jgi:hypothetical protein